MTGLIPALFVAALLFLLGTILVEAYRLGSLKIVVSLILTYSALLLWGAVLIHSLRGIP